MALSASGPDSTTPNNSDLRAQRRVASPEEARYSYSANATVYFSHLLVAIGAFVPQFGLMGLLLTSQVRVGGYYLVLGFIAVSDLITLYFGVYAVLDSWLLGVSEDYMLRSDSGLISAADDESSPRTIVALSRFYKFSRLESDRSVVLVIAGLFALVTIIGMYISWLWFNPLA